jgi:hypothetical protein
MIDELLDSVYTIIESYYPSNKIQYISIYNLVKIAHMDPCDIRTSDLSLTLMKTLYIEGFDELLEDIHQREECNIPIGFAI